jgi:hypothetical protein
MTHRTSLLTTTAIPTPPDGGPIVKTGAELRRDLHGRSNLERAVIADRLVRGELKLDGLNGSQACRVANVHRWYLDYARQRRGGGGNGGAPASAGRASDRLSFHRANPLTGVPYDDLGIVLDGVVEEFGVEAVMSACDRATAPADREF